MKGSCHCGAVSIALAARPDYLHDCNCSLCVQSGALWGYYRTDNVVLRGKTNDYARAEMTKPSSLLHLCKNCGSTTHWVAATHLSHGFMGVNMRLFETAELVGTELRFPNGRDWDKVTPFGYVKSHTIFDGISH